MQDGMHAHILDLVPNRLYQTHLDKLRYLIEQISFPEELKVIPQITIIPYKLCGKNGFILDFAQLFISPLFEGH
jgi:hypothetical protein